MLKIWTSPKFCRLLLQTRFYNPAFKNPLAHRIKAVEKDRLENIIGKGGDFLTMLSIPTSLKQISPFRKELTYITDSVQK